MPFLKSDMKDALVNRIRRTLRRIDRDALKLAYVSLAYWQEDVGDSPVHLGGTICLPAEWESLSDSERHDPRFRTIWLGKRVADEVASLYRELEGFDG